MKTYTKPSVFSIGFDLESFLCTSIQKMMFFVEVDEYQNMGEEALTFDSDY